MDLPSTGVWKCFHTLTHPTERTESSSFGMPLIWKWAFYLHRPDDNCFSLQNQRFPGVVARGKRCFFSSKSVLLYWLRHFNFSLVFLRNASLMEALILVSTLPGEVLTIIDLNRPSPPQPSGKVRTEDGFYRLSHLWFSARCAALSKSRTRWLKERKQGRGSSRGPNLRWASDQRENRGEIGFFIISSWCHFSVIKQTRPNYTWLLFSSECLCHLHQQTASQIIVWHLQDF